MHEKKDFPSPEILWYCSAINARIYKLMEALLPLPCFEYRQKTGECSQFFCPESEGEELCRQRGEIARKLALAIHMNVYDPLHPEYKNLSEKVLRLLDEVTELRHQEPPHTRP